MMKRFLKAWHSSMMLMRFGGPGVFLKQLGRQFYSKSVHIGFELNLQEVDVPRIEAKIKYSMGLASEQDMDEVLEKAKTESNKSAKELVSRWWLYADGYHNCYVARTAETNDLCFMQSVIHQADDKVVSGQFRNWFPELKEDEAILEGAYTFEKYRGNGLGASVPNRLLNMWKEKGIKRVITYIEKDNIASFKVAGKAGFVRFEQVHKLRVLFLSRQKHLPLL
jgi:RimJ/RimL family protein N-acetyltransferase